MTNGSADKTQQRQAFVEEFGLFFERSGLPRMAGRILGWLLVAEPPHESMNDLAEALQASKGSISNMTRFLIEMGLLERVSLPGERRDYFRIPGHAWLRVMERKMSELTHVRELTERALTVMDDASPESRAALQEMHELYAYFEREMPHFLRAYRDRLSSSRE